MRLGQGLGIGAVRTWFPAHTETARHAVDRGIVSEEAAAAMGTVQVPVSPDRAAPEMAVLAARKALSAAGVRGSALGFLAHSWTHYQGHDMWSPVHYIAHQLDAEEAVLLGVNMLCNGSGGAFEAAAARLMTDETVREALVTTGDRFADAGFDRWRSNHGVCYGDSGTATLLHRRDDDADAFTLLSLSSATVTSAELMHRGRDEFSPAPRWLSEKVDIRRTKKAYIEDVGLADFYHEVHSALRRTVVTALELADVPPDSPSLRLLVLPRLGAEMLRKTYLPAVEGLTKADVVRFGDDTGHLGTGDMPTSLDELRTRQMLGPGEIALVLSSGGGFGFTCLVVQRPLG